MTQTEEASTLDSVLQIETRHASFLHRWFDRGATGPSVAKVYFSTVALTYFPLVVSALLSPLPVTQSAAALRLPFLHDWNIAFMFLVTFPSLVILTVSDHAVLASALELVQKQDVVMVNAGAATSLSAKWSQWFRRINMVGYGVGCFTGLSLVYLNIMAYAPADVGFWIASDSRLVFVGYVFAFCIFSFYGLLPLYIFRTIAISVFLRDVVANSKLRMLPFHPDRCGGLRPVGEIGLRSQYALTVVGLNIVSLLAISILYLNVPSSLYLLIAAAASGYLVLGPVVFMGPLLPFRAGMLETKAELMGEVAQRLRVELQRLRSQLPSGQITKDDEELIDRLRKIGGVIDQLPVWPFDPTTLRTFVTAYLLPVLGAVSYPVIQGGIGKFVSWIAR